MPHSVWVSEVLPDFTPVNKSDKSATLNSKVIINTLFSQYHRYQRSCTLEQGELDFFFQNLNLDNGIRFFFH